MRSALLFLFLISLTGALVSQTFLLNGRIRSKEEALPFATVLVKGTSQAINSNAEGDYSLRLPPGNYEIIFQYIGYQRKTIHVSLYSDLVKNVTLEEETVSLSEIVIKAGEDPAYPILRAAIKKRKTHLREAPTYSCTAYIKGLQKMDAMPKNILTLLKLFGGKPSDTNDIKGVIYLSESESNFFYDKPRQKEIMRSSKVSGDSRSFSFNRLAEMNYNFYQNQVEMAGISSRPFISPLNENAFLFYRYYLQGTVEEDGQKFYKIKVVPKNNSDPCYSGLIYILDKSWRLTGVDLLLTKGVQIGFVDTLHIRQLYAPLPDKEIWMPVNLHFAFNFQAFGFNGSGHFNAILSDYKLNPVFKKDFFNNEILVIEAGANTRDSLYWQKHRSIPLTIEESQDYIKKDSAQKIKKTDRYQDSVDQFDNKLKLRDLLLGYRYQRSRKNLVISLPGLLTNGLQFNTVEGLNLSYRFGLQKKYENGKILNTSGRARYGFANKLVGGELSANLNLENRHFSQVGIIVKSIVEQFNSNDPISPLVNSAYTLFYNANFIKLFKESGIQISAGRELVNGLYVATDLRYHRRSALINHSQHALIQSPIREFTSNNPLIPDNDALAFSTNDAFSVELRMAIRFRQKYISYPNEKVVSGSRYPRVDLSYKKAIPFLRSSADYDVVNLQLADGITIGLAGRLSYRINAGYFIRNKVLSFMDYFHFAGNQTLIQTGDLLAAFRLLPYYTYSTQNWYTALHVEHHFKGLVLNRIPLLKKLNWREFVGVHMLKSNQLKNYYELNFGLERIWKVIRIDYVLGYGLGEKFRQGLTVSLSFTF